MSKDKQPEIRFPGFTEAWEQRKLGEIAQKVSVGIATSSSEYFTDKETGVPFVKNQNVKENWIDDSDLEFITHEFDEANRNKRLKTGDILTVRTGYPGLSAVVPSHLEGAQTFTTLITRLKQETALPEYVSAFINSDAGMKQITGMEAGGAQKNVNAGILQNLLIDLPSLAEQKAISDCTKLFDTTITLQQRKLDLLKETKKGFLQKMFPKNGAKMPEIRFPGFTEDWEQRKVGEIFKVTRGQVLAATETSESITEKNIYPVYSSQTKNDGLMGYYSDYLFDTAITWTTDGANAGTVNYRNGKFYSTNVNGVLLSDKGYANKAVAEIINRIAWKHVSKVGNPKLMNNVMSEIIITIPSVEEQETISRFFTQLDSTITLHERELDLLKETKKGFLQKMFV
ncbi:restriction endonuclease subunit S [Enterococcus faecium]|uniref:restriction endonuclease subunit S n=1 Tax=Enterococcus faecium TaxID=1352 RepID=UPI0025427461|nr:restriction endonuclease subunit S [Enterococcus faecium]MDK4371156.1 restriction endonuclease subunit S [Enterococcus faecium]